MQKTVAISAKRLLNRWLPWLLALLTAWIAVMNYPHIARSLARPAMNIRLNYYQIFGSTATELRSQMNQYGPPDPKTGRRFDAYTRWNVRWRYRYGRHRYQGQATRCRTTSLTVEGDVTYTLPQWTSTPETSSGLRQKWDRYMAALRLHEDGHRDHGLQAAQTILEVLQSFHASCETFEADANQAALNIIQHYAQQDRDYDARTQHGRTQGAVFP